MFHMRASGAHAFASLPTGIAHCVSTTLVREAMVVTSFAASPVMGRRLHLPPVRLRRRQARLSRHIEPYSLAISMSR